jgi:presenilin-like A22 family membrane protease
VQDIFTIVAAYYHSVVDPLNPFNRGNIVLYFAWVVVYTFTWVAVWRSERSWFRFVCFVINQLFSIGILISWSLTVILAYAYWQASLAVFAGTGAAGLFLFRRRRH